MNVNLIEYFDTELRSLTDIDDDCDTTQREVVVLVGYGHTVDIVRNELWKLCKHLELELEIEFGFDNGTKIFAIIKRHKDHVCAMRVYVRSVNEVNLMSLRPDTIVMYGNFLAEQVRDVFCFIQQNSHKNLETYFFNR